MVKGFILAPQNAWPWSARGADVSEIKRLASMPTYDQAISMLMAVLKAPTEKLARTMNEVPGKLTRTVAAIRDQK